MQCRPIVPAFKYVCFFVEDKARKEEIHCSLVCASLILPQLNDINFHCPHHHQRRRRWRWKNNRHLFFEDPKIHILPPPSPSPGTWTRWWCNSAFPRSLRLDVPSVLAFIVLKNLNCNHFLLLFLRGRDHIQSPGGGRNSSTHQTETQLFTDVLF